MQQAGEGLRQHLLASGMTGAEREMERDSLVANGNAIQGSRQK
jgi:hypothetical protein